MRKQLGPKNSKSNESRQAKNGGVKGRDRSAEELDIETGEEQITLGRHVERIADDRLPMRAAELREQGRRRRGRKAEMGGLGKERCEEGRRGGRLEEDGRRQRRVEKTSR